MAPIDDLQENDKAQKAVESQQQNEEERKRDIELKNYPRQQNIKIMNMPETKNRDMSTRDLVYDIFNPQMIKLFTATN